LAWAVVIVLAGFSLLALGSIGLAFAPVAVFLAAAIRLADR
jgi:hypothetical protein